MDQIPIVDNIPEDWLEDLLIPPKISVTHRDEQYMYGELDIKSSDILIAKKNLETNRTKEYMKAIEQVELDGWEYLSFKTSGDGIQVRKYRKKV